MERSTLRRSVTAALGGLALLVTACGSSSQSTPVPETPNPNAVYGGTLNMGIWQEPTSFLDAGLVDSLTFSTLTDAPVMEGLLWYRSVDETSNAKSLADYWKPALATEVPTTDNGDVQTTDKGITMSGCTDGAKMCVKWKLRSGVKWHDGSTFSAHDVCDTFQLWWLKYGKNNPTGLQSTTGWDQTIGCKENDAQTAVVSFKSMYGPYLGLGSGVYGILPASILDQALSTNTDLEKLQNTVDLTKGSGNTDAFKGTATLDLMMDGTGPFVFQKYDKTNQIVLVRNKNYWNAAHMPHLDKLVFKIESGIPAEMNAAQSGSVDMAFDLRLGNLAPLLKAAAQPKSIFSVQTVRESGAEKINLNLCANQTKLCGDGPYNQFTADKNIRHAMLMALDRHKMIQGLTATADSAASPGSTPKELTVVPKDSWMYLGVEYLDDPSIPTTAYDPAAAQALLDKDGDKVDPKCSFQGQPYRSFNDAEHTCITVNIGTTNNNQARLDAQRLVESQLAAVGIRVVEPFTPNLAPGDFFDTFADGGPLYNHQFDMALFTTTVNHPAEPDDYYASYHADCGGTCPDSNQIPSKANNGNGQNIMAEDNKDLDAAFDKGRASVDLSARTQAYKDAEKILAEDLPELPLYQQILVETASVKLQSFRLNDIVWDYNTFDWYCTGGNCQA